LRYRWILLVVCLFGLWQGFWIPPVHAQSTQISNVTYPSDVNTTSSSLISPQYVIVGVDVSFANAKNARSLGVFVFDAANLSIPLPGSADGSPVECKLVYVTGTWLSGCEIVISSSEGQEHVVFNVAKRPAPGKWNLVVGAALFGSTDNILSDSVSQYPFSIEVTESLALTVTVPGEVEVTVDGENQSLGSAYLVLMPGSHEVSVPQLVQVNNSTRLKFQGWSDGNGQTDRTLSLSDDVTLEADYLTQYRLTLESGQSNPTGEGWYDSKAIASFSVATTQRMGGILGLLGGFWKFSGWYENGNFVTDSGNGTMAMTSSHHLIANWIGDYTMPLFFSGVVAMIAAVAVFMIQRKGTGNEATSKLVKSSTHNLEVSRHNSLQSKLFRPGR
jgi:hypothetical protein